MSENNATCPICSNPRTEIKLSLPAVTIRSCQSCGHYFQYPVPAPEVLDGIFAGLYAGDMDIINKYVPEWKKFYTGRDEDRAKVYCPKILQRRLELSRRFVSPGRLLDIGCGFGQFIQVAVQSGWEVEGVEPSLPARDYIERKIGIKVRETSPDNLREYQLITLWDVVEHQPSPREFLEEIARSVGPGSVLAITVPNRNCLLNWLAEFTWKISGGKFDGPLKKFYFISHLQYFSPASLRLLLEKSGFKVLRQTGEDTCLDNLDMGGAAKVLLRMIFIISRLLGSRNRILIYSTPDYSSRLRKE